ncbi:MAG: transglutaminase-like domain-containing protein [Syntrophomonadaceae bacterium]|nr:transglutaminase-like domain-containing protein [Syntrophomonadaceae bacterium]
MFNRGFKLITYTLALTFLMAACMPQMAIAKTVNDSTLNRKVQISVKVTNTGSQTATAIRVQLPLISADSPYQKTVQETFNQKVEKIETGEAGSRIAHILINSIGPGQSENIIVDYVLNIKPEGGLVASSNSEMQQYLKPSNKIESNNPDIAAKAKQIAASADGEIATVNAIGNFISSHMKYELNSPYKNKGALSALNNGEGVCEDYAALFVAMCRASGIPARQVNGFTDPKLTGASWNTPEASISLQGYRHAWAEVYVKDMGWIAVDPTFNIYPQQGSKSIVKLSNTHIAQNYYDQPVKVNHQGAKLSVGWGNLLINNNNY